MEANILRARARASLTDIWGLSIGVAALAALLGGLLIGESFLPNISYEFPIPFPFLEEAAAKLEEGFSIDRFRLSFNNGIFGLAAFLLGGTLQLGYARFLLKQHDGEPCEFNDLFSQFDRFGTGFAQKFLRTLYVALWSLLLIVPGICKHYSYAMTPFILEDHPELTAGEAIRRSEEIMDGHKMDLFILELTFLGWELLSAMTLYLGNLVLNPYKNAARAAFYRQLQAQTRYTTYE